MVMGQESLGALPRLDGGAAESVLVEPGVEDVEGLEAVGGEEALVGEEAVPLLHGDLLHPPARLIEQHDVGVAKARGP